MNIKTVYALVWAAHFCSYLSAQDDGRGCLTHHRLQERLDSDPSVRQRLEAVERQAQIATDRAQPRGQIIIPVVVHVLYNRPEENISDAQITSQIEALNRDFNRENKDIAQVPDLFQPAAANVGIRFQLAVRDPNGFATTGIKRVYTEKTRWSLNDDMKFAARGGSDIWDATKYLNIWVCNIGSQFGGFAELPGMGNPQIDGVVIDSRRFGTVGTVERPYHLGRTCTHEVAHWFNLYHIWGDATCGDDHVSDTPVQERPTFGKHAFPLRATCNGSTNVCMTMNFMDYVDDDQMFFFTEGQRRRMLSTLTDGGYRASLLNSDGCKPSQAVACGAVNTLWANFVGTNQIEIAWLPMQNTTYYNVAYRTIESDDWTTDKTTQSSWTIKNLKADKQYEIRIKPDCSGSEWSNTRRFQTSSSEPECFSERAEQKIPNNTTIKDAISQNNQTKRYTIRTTLGEPNLKIVLRNLPADYDLKLLSGNRQVLQTSNNKSTASETIIFNANTEGVYYLDVVGYNGAFDANNCFELTVNAAPTTFNTLENRSLRRVISQDFVVAPNPATDNLTIIGQFDKTYDASVRLYDMNGHLIREFKQTFSKDVIQANVDVSDFTNGVYFVSLLLDNEIRTKRFVVNR